MAQVGDEEHRLTEADPEEAVVEDCPDEHIPDLSDTLEMSVVANFVCMVVLVAIGSFWTTEEDGFPLLAYALYLFLLAHNKYAEYNANQEYLAADPKYKAIFKDVYGGIGLNYWAVVFGTGALGHQDVFADVVFISVSYTSGYHYLAYCAAGLFILSSAFQLLVSCSLAMYEGYIETQSLYGDNFAQTVLTPSEASKSAELRLKARTKGMHGFLIFGGMDLVSGMLARRFEWTDEVAFMQLWMNVIAEKVPSSVIQALYISNGLASMSVLAQAKILVPMFISQGLTLKAFARYQSRGMALIGVLLSAPPFVVLWTAYR